MAFWDLFVSKEEKTFSSRLHQKLANEFPSANEEELTKWACIAGLLANVAHRDLVVTDEEKAHMKKALIKWTKLNEHDAASIKNIALSEIEDLSNLEVYKYCEPLRDLLTKSQRYELLETLFDLAASDGEADNSESEEIRSISKGLLLESPEFLAARASVLKSLKITK